MTILQTSCNHDCISSKQKTNIDIYITIVPRFKYEVRGTHFPYNYQTTIYVCSDCKQKYDSYFSDKLTIDRRASHMMLSYHRPELVNYKKLKLEGKEMPTFIKRDGLYFCDLYPDLPGANYVFYHDEHDVEDFFQSV
jgi:hypothetical protein